MFNGGLHIKTTLDFGMQRAAEQAIAGYLPGPGGPTASLVAIENSTGQVRAMVGGRNYNKTPFQPRHRGRAPAGILVQGIRPGGGLGGRHLPGVGVALAPKDLLRAQPRTARKSSWCTTTKAPTRARTR